MRTQIFNFVVGATGSASGFFGMPATAPAQAPSAQNEPPVARAEANVSVPAAGVREFTTSYGEAWNHREEYWVRGQQPASFRLGTFRLEPDGQLTRLETSSYGTVDLSKTRVAVKVYSTSYGASRVYRTISWRQGTPRPAIAGNSSDLGIVR